MMSPVLFVYFFLSSACLTPLYADCLYEPISPSGSPAPDSATSQTAYFTPPKNWKQTGADKLPPHVKALVVGSGPGLFPPSMNLSIEKFNGSLFDYLRIVKEINRSHGSDWKDLGKIRTLAGEASLSQADADTHWGAVRMLHVILLKDGMIYILTASALKDEFSMYQKTFYESLKSLNVERRE